MISVTTNENEEAAKQRNLNNTIFDFEVVSCEMGIIIDLHE
jgi:hypothetical protein